MKIICILLVVLLVVLAGCDDNQLGIDKRRPNRPPDTVLSSGPPDSTHGTPYKVHLYWWGNDPDGDIDHYDFIMVDHPAIGDSIEGGAAHRVDVAVPAPDDPRWTATHSRDSLFTTRADTLRRDPRPGPGEPLDRVREAPFERWHTFFVRAVDNEGTCDQTPDYRTFNSQTLAPTLGLNWPVRAGSTYLGPRVIVFRWNGEDPVGDGSSVKPVATRWVLIESLRGAAGRYTSFPESLYHLPERYRWSPWAKWGAADSAGVRAVVRNLRTVADGGTGAYIFAVQAVDEAGAVTQVFDYQTPGKNNSALISVKDDLGARLTITERYLGTFNVVHGTPPVNVDVGAGQPIRFRWRGAAADYGGTIAGYRYGWNLRNLSNDEEWQQGWSQTALEAPEVRFADGTQHFYLQVRDNAGTVTRAEFELTVYPVRRRRELLFVDDTRHDDDLQLASRRWLAVIDSLRGRHPFDFDPVYDVYVPRDNGGNTKPPPIGLLFDYKVVVWAVYANNGSALGRLARFADPFAASTQTTPPPYNYVNIYLENQGKMWVSGFSPAVELWPPKSLQLPVNVTNWASPALPNRIDSVGTISLLYKMGVEMFDRGGGLGATGPRTLIAHWCRGPRRAVPPSSRLQTFTSSLALGHHHSVSRPDSEWAADVDALPAEGRLYTTDAQERHAHTILVTQEDFRKLQRGATVTVATSVPVQWQAHTHTLELVDQVGLWGAPPVLAVDAGRWPVPADYRINPRQVRPNVEIFNMPEQMERESRPLRASRSLPLYTYVSGDAPRSAAQFYPNTADGEPVFVLAKGTESDPYYTRAFCGFEPYVLSLYSHVALADFILWRHFHVGQRGAP